MQNADVNANFNKDKIHNIEYLIVNTYSLYALLSWLINYINYCYCLQSNNVQL